MSDAPTYPTFSLPQPANTYNQRQRLQIAKWLRGIADELARLDDPEEHSDWLTEQLILC